MGGPYVRVLGRGLTPARAHGFGQLVQGAGSRLPVHAGVGDGLAVGELAGVEVLAPGDEERLEHHADDRAVALGDLSCDVGATSRWRSGSLFELSWEASTTTRWGRPLAASCASTSATSAAR